MIILNGEEVIFGTFPNNEMYLSLDQLKTKAPNLILWVYEDDSEFLKLTVLKGCLDDKMSRSHLEIHYMPHSRMDRENGEYAMSLKYAAQLINNMGFDRVCVVEPHSDVTPALLNRSTQLNWCMKNVDKAITASNAGSLFYPDAGAAKRYVYDMPYAIGHKQRDFKTGKITSFDLIGKVFPNVLIVDDLCSRGGTFVHSSVLLKNKGAEKVSLLVAHCERTVYKGELFDHIDTLYTSKDNQLGKALHPQIVLI